jgi:hypothetical protein
MKLMSLRAFQLSSELRPHSLKTITSGLTMRRLSPREVVTILDYAMGSLAARLRVGKRYLKDQLSTQGVNVPLSEGCLEEFVRNSREAVTRTRKPGEPYLSCLRRHLEARARFVFLWTGSDERFDRDAWDELIAIAQKYALPRWRKPVSNPAPSQRPAMRRDTIPEHLVTGDGKH